MKISELADRIGLPANTIRYYETCGVAPPPERLPNGYRTYGADDERRLQAVAAADTFRRLPKIVSEMSVP